MNEGVINYFSTNLNTSILLQGSFFFICLFFGLVYIYNCIEYVQEQVIKRKIVRSETFRKYLEEFSPEGVEMSVDDKEKYLDSHYKILSKPYTETAFIRADIILKQLETAINAITLQFLKKDVKSPSKIRVDNIIPIIIFSLFIYIVILMSGISANRISDNFLDKSNSGHFGLKYIWTTQISEEITSDKKEDRYKIIDSCDKPDYKDFAKTDKYLKIIHFNKFFSYLLTKNKYRTALKNRYTIALKSNIYKIKPGMIIYHQHKIL